MRAVAMVLRRKGGAYATEAELKDATEEILRDKAAMKTILKDAKQEYDANKGKSEQ